MALIQPNPNGQATMANSSPVTLASNQSTVKTKLATDIADVLGTITTATSAVTMTDLSGVGSVTVTIYGAAHAGVNVTFEAYDGVNWVGIAAQQWNSTTPSTVVTTGVLTSNSTNRWNISPLFGSQQFRVRATAWTSGTANVIIEASAQFTQYQVNVATMPTTAVTMATNTPVGNVAHDAVDSGAPVKMGGKAYTANPTAVANADRSDIITDKLGKQVVVGSIRDLKVQQVTTITNTTETTILTAGAAGVFHDLYGLVITNTSATAVNVAIKDATAGTTRVQIAVPAGDTRGFMLNESAAHNQATAAANWTATASAAVSSLIITALAVKNV